jgi:predicted anti-sigma-YlaC factor YlaD
MNCTTAQESLSQWMDGELPVSNDAELFSHLSGCAACRAFFRDLQTVHQGLASVPALQVPVALDQRILAIHAHPSSAPQKFWFRPGRSFSFRTVGFAVIFSIIASVFFSSFWYHHSQPQQTIVCLTPLPEVEVTGYVVVASPQ